MVSGITPRCFEILEHQNASRLVLRLRNGANLDNLDFYQIVLTAALLRALAKPSASS
jgi:hypothetical protein